MWAGPMSSLLLLDVYDYTASKTDTKLSWIGCSYTHTQHSPPRKKSQANERIESFQITSAMSLTSLNTVYLSNEINRFFPMNGKVTVNATLMLVDTSHTRSLVVKRDIQKKLIEVIQVTFPAANGKNFSREHSPLWWGSVCNWSPVWQVCFQYISFVKVNIFACFDSIQINNCSREHSR